jgi:S-formylglutathione hydrolase FrmB
MSLFHAHFSSETLGLQCAADVILPDRPPADRDLPCLWLLHGLSDDHTMWQRRTSIERYAAAYRLAIVMPAVHRSFYADMASGYAYWTFISDELPQLMRAYFRLSARREDNFVAGLSMGGYGAFKLALNLPGRYAAAASLSGVLDLCAHWNATPHGPDRKLVFGDAGPQGGSGDLCHVARQLVASGQPLPALFQWCGTEDYLYPNNLRFRDFAKQIGLPVGYAEGPGAHDWGYWDARIQDVLKWLPLA